MKVFNGEELFESFEEAMKNIYETTTSYEKENDIKPINYIVKFDKPDLKVVNILKTDGSETSFIFYNNSVKKSIWKTWCINKDQIDYLIDIWKVIQATDFNNTARRIVAWKKEKKK